MRVEWSGCEVGWGVHGNEVEGGGSVRVFPSLNVGGAHHGANTWPLAGAKLLSQTRHLVGVSHSGVVCVCMCVCFATAGGWRRRHLHTHIHIHTHTHTLITLITCFTPIHSLCGIPPYTHPACRGFERAGGDTYTTQLISRLDSTRLDSNSSPKVVRRMLDHRITLRRALSRYLRIGIRSLRQSAHS